jgi:hypothetical protein
VILVTLADDNAAIAADGGDPFLAGHYRAAAADGSGAFFPGNDGASAARSRDAFLTPHGDTTTPNGD